MRPVYTAVLLTLLYTHAHAQTHMTMERRPGKDLIVSFLDGRDDRSQVERQNLEKLPYSAVVKILQNGSYICTGTVVASTLILTAAHCVLKRDPKFSDRTVSTALTAETHSREKYTIVAAYLAPKYRPRAPSNRIPIVSRDVALLETAKPIARETGHLGVANDLKEDYISVILAGYHDDLPLKLQQQGCRALDVITDWLSKDRIDHNCDAATGSSGSPLLVEHNNAFYIIGVNSGAEEDQRNYAAVIGGYEEVDQFVFDRLSEAGISVWEPDESEGIVPYFGAQRSTWRNPPPPAKERSSMPTT